MVGINYRLLHGSVSSWCLSFETKIHFGIVTFVFRNYVFCFVFFFLVGIEKLSQILITYSLGLVVCNLVLVLVSIRILSQKLRGRLLLRLGILLEFTFLAHYMFLVDLIRLDKAQELLGGSGIFFGINFFLLNCLMLINTRYSN